MKPFLALLVIWTVNGWPGACQTVSGTISGVLRGEDATPLMGATIRIHMKPAATTNIPPLRTDWSVVTTMGGAFQLTGLPEGTYNLCPRAPNTTWLNPCEWKFPTPIATISRAAPNATITITMKRGVAVPIRINDSGQLMAQNEGKTAAGGLLLTLSSPGLIFRSIPVFSEDSSGRNYQIVVPFNTQLSLHLQPASYNLSDANGAALPHATSTNIPLFVQTGQQVTPIHFNISGVVTNGGGK